MPGWKIALIVGIMICVDVVVVSLIMRMIAQSVGDLAKKFPPIEPAVGAISKRFQSFRFDMINMGGNMHASVDERALHLSPAWIARRIGLRPMSIPWEAIAVTKPGRRSTQARIGQVDLVGPTWCLELATPPRESQA
jgi:hypothetical protein